MMVESTGGIAALARIYCDACQCPRAATGSLGFGRYLLCRGCCCEYELAQERGMNVTPGQYVRDKQFGEGAWYTVLA